MEPDLARAIGASHLRDLPSELLDELLADSVRATFPAGSVIHLEREDAPYLELVVSGVVRVFVSAPDGRTMTVRYCRPGELLGAMSLFSPGFSEAGTKSALIDAELLRMSPTRARRIAEKDVRVARAFLIELSERAHAFVHEISGSAFASVRQRVARQLLDLASTGEGKTNGELAAYITQRDLAAAAGTVREVVVRALRSFRENGVVRTEHDRIVILEPALLTEEAKWNSSS